MYFTTKKFDIFSVRDDFATLKNISENDDLTFEFTYSISQKKALENNAFFVKINVSTQAIKKQPIIPLGSLGKYDTKSIVSNILLNSQNVQNAVKSQDSFVVARAMSDLTSFINNDIASILASSQPASTISALKKTSLRNIDVSKIKQTNNNQPVLHTTIIKDSGDSFQTSGSIGFDTRTLSHKMLLIDGVDPSYITEMTHKSITATESVDGTLKKTRTRNDDIDAASQLQNYFLYGTTPTQTTTSQIVDGNIQQIRTTEIEDIIDIDVEVIIPTKNVDDPTAMYFVSFDLINNLDGSSICSVSKKIDIQKHINSFLLPKIPPKVKMTANTQDVTLDIQQVDSVADGIVIYRKIINKDEQVDDSYQQYGSFDIQPNKSLKITVDNPYKSTVIYRIIPKNEQRLGFEFTSVVVSPQNKQSIKSLALAVSTTSTGVSVSIKSIPVTAISFQVFVRNLTIFEKEYSAVTKPILIDDSLRSLDSFSTIDKSVKNLNTYEYVVKIFHNTSVSDFSTTSLIEYAPASVGKVSTVVSNVQITHNQQQPNVTFSFETSVIDENIDVIIDLLKKQGLYDIFQKNVVDERESLKGIIAHNIQRVNLSTGLREDFGVITSSDFSDVLLQEKNSVLPLEYGKNYRYEIFVLKRTIESTFESLVKEKIDPVTGKTYNFSVLKFFHPVVSQEGMLVSTQGLNTNYSKTMMEHGLVGLTQTVEVSFENNNTQIQSANVIHFNKKMNVISWNILGNVTFVDYFLIIKEVHNIRTIVGKTNSQTTNNVFQHFLTSRDTGQLRYAIIPVYLDYSVGQTSYTNSLVVEL